MATFDSKKLPKRLRRSYTITVTGGGLVLKPDHPEGWFNVEVNFVGQQHQLRATVKEDAEGAQVQLRSVLPDWLAEIVCDDLFERWVEFRNKTIEGLLDGSVVPGPDPRVN